MSSIKITSQYDIDKALVGINPTQHPEAYRLLRALKGIADVERDTGSIYELAGNVVSGHIKDTKIAQLTSEVARLQTKLGDTQTKLAESDFRLRTMIKEAEFQRDRADKYKARVHSLRYPNWR